MTDNLETILADSFALNAVLLSLIDRKSYLLIMEAIENLPVDADKKARLLIQLERTCGYLEVDASSMIQSTLARVLESKTRDEKQ